MRAVIVPAGCVLLLGLLTACGSGDPKDGGTVTVTVPPSPAAQPSGSASGSASGTVSPTATPSPVATALPGTCASLLPDYDVGTAVGVPNLGQTAYVVGVADPTIGRLSTVNCRYGVTGSGAAQKTKVEIGVSLYATAAQADQRISATRDDYVSHGGTPSEVQVPPAAGTTALTATLLSGGAGQGYTLPLLVVAADRRTVAVTVDPAAIRTPQAAVTLAALAIKRTTT